MRFQGVFVKVLIIFYNLSINACRIRQNSENLKIWLPVCEFQFNFQFKHNEWEFELE